MLGSSLCFCVLLAWGLGVWRALHAHRLPSTVQGGKPKQHQHNQHHQFQQPANPVPFSHEQVERLPKGEFRQELMDCLGQGGTPSDAADLAYSSFPPHPPGVVLPHHHDLLGNSCINLAHQPCKLCQQQHLVELIDSYHF